jgi:uncharacterized protein YndB with AHSA1/START domain
MTVLSIDKDAATRTMVITSEFDADVDGVWQLWADPRLLERWWGPPTYPATVDLHDLSPGGKVTYFMTGPEGEKYGGYFNVFEVEAPTRLSFEDGFANGDDGTPNEAMPVTRIEVSIAAAGDKTRMLVTSTFSSTEAMEQLLAMGMDEGMRSAMGQIDALLAEVAR